MFVLFKVSFGSVCFNGKLKRKNFVGKFYTPNGLLNIVYNLLASSLGKMSHPVWNFLWNSEELLSLLVVSCFSLNKRVLGFYGGLVSMLWNFNPRDKKNQILLSGIALVSVLILAFLINLDEIQPATNFFCLLQAYGRLSCFSSFHE
jgi:hypothetical protein